MSLTIYDIKLQINNEADFTKVYDILYKYNQQIDEDSNQFSKVDNQLICLKTSKEWALDNDYLNTRTSVDFETFEKILKINNK